MSNTSATPDFIQRRLPITLQIEPRLQTGRWLPIVSSIAALVLALFFGGILIALVGGDPIATYAHIANVAFGSLGGITDTLTKATPLDSGGPGVFAGVSHEIVEHRRGRAVLHGRMGGQCRGAAAHCSPRRPRPSCSFR